MFFRGGCFLPLCIYAIMYQKICMCNCVYTTVYVQCCMCNYTYRKKRMKSGSFHTLKRNDYCMYVNSILQEHNEIMREGDFCADFSVSAADQLISRRRLEVRNKLIQ